ncbi:metallophosphoesterase family protein [Patulibacter minatonensis]|uniref:metallophosphoesterase family protein n=1 Tax=Patulibacter minatonensis TaxID=298163 RepID=UPI00047E0749|nr:metallophosphoesterase [Patulibacter minatonensis]
MRVPPTTAWLRRSVALLVAGTIVLLVLLLVGGGDDDPPRTGSTLDVTVRDPSGSGVLRDGPGEHLRDRRDLLPAGTATPSPGKELATVAQLTDTHVRDTASPARIPFLDRLGAPFNPIFRPQEGLTLQTLAAATKTVNRLDPQLTVVTGDLVDNDQQNELTAAITALKGGRVRPFDAHALQGADNADPFYYRPDVDPPREPGLLDRARRPFTAPGLDGPVAVVPGNHDVLVGGEVLATPALRAVAVGDRRLVTPDPAFARTIPRDAGAAQQAVNALLSAGRLPGTTAAVRADPTRRLLSGPEVVGQLAKAGLASDRDGRADTVRDLGTGVRVILLDDVPRGGDDEGPVDPAQQAFLDRALTTAGDRWVLVAFHDPLDRTPNGRAFRARLARAPRVLATIGGDTHHDEVVPVRTPSGGYWSLTTSALADWPQQGRALRVRETAGGGAVLETWKLDTAPDPLADTARELAYLDAQGGRPGKNAGTAKDRNVRLFKPAPR